MIKSKLIPTTNTTNKSRKFSLNLEAENKSNSTVPSFKVFFNIDEPNPISNPNNYPATPPVIPINAYPCFAIAIVVSPSGNAFPIAKIVRPI